MIITPKSKLMQVLDAFPELEEILISYIPAFKDLKNPILRKTIAKIATMQQVAAIGHIKAEDLINMLRKLVGQDCIESSDDFKINRDQPEWYKHEKVTKSFDARDMLAQGEHPVNQVISDLSEIGSTAIYELIASFLPVPLIEKGASLEFEHWVEESKEGLVKVYFSKR
ncbi:MAG: DUF1858 domain-containing protein [Candidatus Marinimicrobia bacterium]|nr:DUF1858 domain-containing protein [Candidatus Neomarinimicrobiota bacterium]